MKHGPTRHQLKDCVEHRSEVSSQGTRELGLLPNSHPSVAEGCCFRDVNSTALPAEQAPAAGESPQARRHRDLRQEAFLVSRECSMELLVTLPGKPLTASATGSKTKPPNYEATSETLYSIHWNSNQ